MENGISKLSVLRSPTILMTTNTSTVCDLFISDFKKKKQIKQSFNNDILNGLISVTTSLTWGQVLILDHRSQILP